MCDKSARIQPRQCDLGVIRKDDFGFVTLKITQKC
jgi:hypothetical protein